MPIVRPIGGLVSRITGKERDAETALDYFGARYYGSNLGRFLTPDWADKPTAVPYAELGDPQTLNLYGYVRNNPLSKADADGHCPWCLGALFGGAIGAGQVLHQTYQAVVNAKGHIPTNSEIAGKVLGGMVSGAIGGAGTGSIMTNVVSKTGTQVVTATLGQQMTQGAVASVVGGVVDRGISTGEMSKAANVKAMAADALSGAAATGIAAKLTGATQLSQNAEYLAGQHASPGAIRPEITAQQAVGDTVRSMTTQLQNTAAGHGALGGAAAAFGQGAADAIRQKQDPSR